MVGGCWARGIALLAAAWLVASCGGGGSSGGGGGEATGSNDGLGHFVATFNVPVASASGVQGSAESVALRAELGYDGSGALGLVALYDGAVVLDVAGEVSGNVLTMTVTLRGDLSIGHHDSSIELHACADETCAHEPQGSPAVLPISYDVKPNLEVQPSVSLSRSGSEPAPSVLLPIVAPPEAGALTIEPAQARGMTVTVEGAQVRVQTSQFPAGQYDSTFTLRSASDPRYARQVAVSYTVLPPPGGEKVLQVDDPVRSIFVQQGSRSVQHLVVTRPTWTDAFDPPVLVDPSLIGSIAPAADGNWDLTIDAVGRDPGTYGVTVQFSAGPTGGGAMASITATVTGVAYVDGSLNRAVDVSSSLADLAWSNPVRTFDGVAARWSAVSRSPLLHIVRSSGQTDLDALEVAFDPAALAGPDSGFQLPVDVTIDRPGTSPVTVNYSLANGIPTLQRLASSPLVGSSGRIVIDGAFNTSDLLSSGKLRVDGATLTGARVVSDPRFAGFVASLYVDVSDAVVGRPVTVSLDSALLPTRVQASVVAPPRPAAGLYQALPFAAYRPPQVAPGLDALYVGSPGMAYRWSWDAATLTSAGVSGLLDVAPAPDGSALYATSRDNLVVLDPKTLTTLDSASLRPNSPAAFDSAAPANTRIAAFSADGRLMASFTDVNFPSAHGAAWFCSQQSTRVVPALTVAPRPCDPSVQSNPDLAATAGFGLVRSVNGRSVIGFGSLGERFIYDAEARYWVYRPTAAVGTTLAAVADDGSRIVRGDGLLTDGNEVALGNLAGIVPFSHVAGGYGLVSNGRFALVYGYQLVGDTASQSAADPTLWVVDLRDVASAGIGVGNVVATLALPQAVGCTVAPLASGETCRHAAAIVVAPGDGVAFVLGPRGIVAIPLPQVVSAVARGMPSTRGQAQPLRRGSLRGTLTSNAVRSRDTVR